MSEDTSTAENASQELPDWARDQITKANSEAAKYRSEKNDLATALKQAKEEASGYTTKVTELEEQLAASRAEVQALSQGEMRLRAALNVGIDNDKLDDFAALLKGDTAEEVAAHAEKLKALFGSDPAPARATDPSQGSAPLPLNGDPLVALLTSAVN